MNRPTNNQGWRTHRPLGRCIGRSRNRRILRWIVRGGVCGLLALAAAQPLAASAFTQWGRADSSCLSPPADPATAVVACGAYGRYFLTTESLPLAASCPFQVTSRERPPHLPLEESSGVAAAAFGRDGGPWVAVVDWSGPHSADVGELIVLAADYQVDVELFDIGTAWPEQPAGLGEASDAHLLVLLCALAQQVADDPEDAPLGLHMSFGRMADPEEDCLAGAVSLACEIEGLLDFLHRDHGVVPVAKAGDHRELLFPARAAGVLAVGTLDTLRWARDGSAAATWETEVLASAVAPGYGLLIGAGESSRAVPPGSSAAAAVLSGWLAGTRARGLWQPLMPLEPQVSFAPWLADGAYLLAHGSDLLPGSDLAGVQVLMAQALGIAAGTPPPPPDLPTLTLGGSANIFLGYSLPRMVARATRSWPPLPTVYPCIPCGGGAIAADVINTSPDGSGGTTDPPGSGALMLDLSASVPWPAEYTLTEILAQVDGEPRRLYGGQDPALLAEWAAAELDGVLLEGFGPEDSAAFNRLPSLIFLFDMEGDKFWTVAPLALASP